MTDAWKASGMTKNYEYAVLTNEIYKTWSGMKASEYKKFKGVRKESLRDNMTDLEVLLIDIGEVTTRELTKEHKPLGLEENIKIARTGGEIAKNTRKDIENKLGKKVISDKNSLKYQYINDDKMIESNK